MVHGGLEIRLKPFQPGVAFHIKTIHLIAFHIETSHLICSANQMTGFYMKHNAGLSWVKDVLWSTILQNKYTHHHHLYHHHHHHHHHNHHQ